jgi:hypothetical protein
VIAQLTKRVVAQRQLIASIRLLYDGADLVPVYSLAANAWEIVDTLATRAGVDSISNQTREHIPFGKDLKLNYINSPYRNFFKHADKDPDASVPSLKDENVESIVFLAVEDYLRMFGMSPIEFQVYQLWYLAKNEEKLSTDAMGRVRDDIREVFPNIRSLTRGEQLSMARSVLASAHKDGDLGKDPRTEGYL